MRPGVMHRAVAVAAHQSVLLTSSLKVAQVMQARRDVVVEHGALAHVAVRLREQQRAQGERNAATSGSSDRHGVVTLLEIASA